MKPLWIYGTLDAVGVALRRPSDAAKPLYGHDYWFYWVNREASRPLSSCLCCCSSSLSRLRLLVELQLNRLTGVNVLLQPEGSFAALPPKINRRRRLKKGKVANAETGSLQCNPRLAPIAFGFVPINDEVSRLLLNFNGADKSGGNKTDGWRSVDARHC